MSQKQAVEKTIGEHKYEMYMLAPKTSHTLLVKVMKMLGPSLGPVADMFFNKLKNTKNVSEIMNQEVGAEFFSKAANTLFNDLDNAIIDDVIDKFGDVTHVDGVPLKGIFDAHFLGSLGEMYQWLFWGMQVQWGKSLTGLVDLIPLPSLKEKTKEQ
jgi:hypothetical protein